MAMPAADSLPPPRHRLVICLAPFPSQCLVLRQLLLLGSSALPHSSTPLPLLCPELGVLSPSPLPAARGNRAPTARTELYVTTSQGAVKWCRMRTPTKGPSPSGFTTRGANRTRQGLAGSPEAGASSWRTQGAKRQAGLACDSPSRGRAGAGQGGEVAHDCHAAAGGKAGATSLSGVLTLHAHCRSHVSQPLLCGSPSASSDTLLGATHPRLRFCASGSQPGRSASSLPGNPA